MIIADPLERRKEQHGLLKRIDRQNWHLWLVCFSVIISLSVALASLFYPALRWHLHNLEVSGEILPQLLAGLLTLVLLCVIYIIVKEREINELRNFLIATNLEAHRLRDDLPRDPLTGVLERRALPDVMKREVTWVDRYRVPLTLLLFNVRGFRAINAAEGNLGGDEILKMLAWLMGTTARQTDTILRYGPDRFLCFLPRTDEAGAKAFARRVTDACQENSRLRRVQLSFGIVGYRPGANTDKVLAEIEQNLAKMAGDAATPQVHVATLPSR